MVGFSSKLINEDGDRIYEGFFPLFPSIADESEIVLKSDYGFGYVPEEMSVPRDKVFLNYLNDGEVLLSFAFAEITLTDSEGFEETYNVFDDPSVIRLAMIPEPLVGGQTPLDENGDPDLSKAKFIHAVHVIIRELAFPELNYTLKVVQKDGSEYLIHEGTIVKYSAPTEE